MSSEVDPPSADQRAITRSGPSIVRESLFEAIPESMTATVTPAPRARL
jgi:hypothetical protein